MKLARHSIKIKKIMSSSNIFHSILVSYKNKKSSAFFLLKNQTEKIAAETLFKNIVEYTYINYNIHI